MIVEDEPIIAFDLAEQLTDRGYSVVGIAGTVSEAFDIYGRLGCDVAILDVNLGAETAAPVAARLVADKVPFVTLTGYGQRQCPPEFDGAPLLAKPVRFPLLVRTLEGFASDPMVSADSV